MGSVHLFGDEAGDLTFRSTGSKFFTICTVTMMDTEIERHMLELRRELVKEGVLEGHFFHASEDRQPVRDRVFALLAVHDFRVDATILDKTKAHPHLANDWRRFYKTAWYLHLKAIAGSLVGPEDDLFVVAASIQQTRHEMEQIRGAVADVCSQVLKCKGHHTACWPSATDPCLQVSDYCCWAVHRKWTRGDARSYDLIKEKVRTEFQPFLKS